MTAQTLIWLAFEDIGVYQQGETPTATESANALTRLNNMVKGWLIQSLTPIATERQVFNIVANQATYDIGTGGQWDVVRPNRLERGGLLLNGLTSAISVTSITRSTYTATVTQTAHGYAVGDQVLILGATQKDYNGTQTVLSTPTADTWTFNVNALPVTPATGTITAQQFNSATGNPPATEIPRSVLTVDAYASIQVKNLENPLFTNIYYIPTYPFGQIFLWPTPNTNVNQVVLYLDTQFAGFADLTTDYTFPDAPGYAEALEYNLAARLAEPFGRTLPPGVAALAMKTFGALKRENYQLTDAAVDPMFTWNRRGGYNINTGNM